MTHRQRVWWACGCSETKFCPERVITHSELSVIVYRARYKRMAGNQSASVPDPPACTANAFNDVPCHVWYCPWVKAVTDVIGTNAIAANCPGRPSDFCPEVILSSGYFLAGLRVRRGTTAFYLVNGVLNADNPQSLPTSFGDVPAVDVGGTSSECDYSGVSFTNWVGVVGSQIFGYSATGVDNFSNTNLWSFYLSASLRQNTTALYSQTPSRLAHSGWAQMFQATTQLALERQILVGIYSNGVFLCLEC